LTYTVTSVILYYQIGGFSSLPFELLLSRVWNFYQDSYHLYHRQWESHSTGFITTWECKVYVICTTCMCPNKNMSFFHLIVEFWCYQEIWQIWKWWQAQATNSCSSSEKKVSRTKAGQAES